MSTTEAEDYVKRAEECLCLAGACIAESNRQILIYAAPTGGCWPKKLQRGARPRSGPNPTSTPPRAIAQEIEARDVRTRQVVTVGRLCRSRGWSPSRPECPGTCELSPQQGPLF